MCDINLRNFVIRLYTLVQNEIQTINQLKFPLKSPNIYLKPFKLLKKDALHPQHTSLPPISSIFYFFLFSNYAARQHKNFLLFLMHIETLLIRIVYAFLVSCSSLSLKNCLYNFTSSMPSSTKYILSSFYHVQLIFLK